jgi:hypothetical protein
VWDQTRFDTTRLLQGETRIYTKRIERGDGNFQFEQHPFLSASVTSAA